VRVLLVDDDVSFRVLVRTLLEAAGLPVEIVGEAGDGEEAIALAVELEPDVILMDLDMPRLDGAAATLAIKRVLPETRVLMLTGSVRAQEAAETAAVELIPKPALDVGVLDRLLRAS
jgi:DNA-binding NarL/FixJ family response regulator